MSIDNSLDRIIGLVDDSHEAVKAKGGTTTTPYLLTNLPNAIKSIPEGEDLSAEITEYGSLNDELEEVINSLPSAGGGGGGQQVATGIAEYDGIFISAYGLGFTPKFVAIIPQTSGAMQNFVGTLISSCYGEINGTTYSFDVEAVLTAGSGNNIQYSTPSCIEIEDEGFSALPNGTALASYMYIAIG